MFWSPSRRPLLGITGRYLDLLQPNFKLENRIISKIFSNVFGVCWLFGLIMWMSTALTTSHASCTQGSPLRFEPSLEQQDQELLLFWDHSLPGVVLREVGSLSLPPCIFRPHVCSIFLALYRVWLRFILPRWQAANPF